ncbi:hypothetical protein Y032_0028g1642 [Ancylostoma ceylanicum]|uniref:Secreted protein n=1 Tax=Ancylostoma ceylanicum TaxID=53326 RepID=A0A016UTB7_9BILA|nr:hypothetical protein Y032_0028g1642 [Ancylostoma ceylanicum]
MGVVMACPLFGLITRVWVLGRPLPILAHDPFSINNNNPFKKRLVGISVDQIFVDSSVWTLVFFAQLTQNSSTRLPPFTTPVQVTGNGCLIPQ